MLRSEVAEAWAESQGWAAASGQTGMRLFPESDPGKNLKERASLPLCVCVYFGRPGSIFEFGMRDRIIVFLLYGVQQKVYITLHQVRVLFVLSFYKGYN